MRQINITVTTALLFFSFYSCIAQYPIQNNMDDSITVKLNIPHYQDKQKDTIPIFTSLGTGFITGWGGTFDSAIRKLDTIKVLLLACDTSSSYRPSLKFTEDSIYVKEPDQFYHHEVFWIKGYEVKCMVDISNKLKTTGQIKLESYEHLYYLDSEKKLLKKNIVVWLSK